MKLTDHGDLDPAVEKRLEIEDAVREKYRADELAWQTRLVRDALRARRYRHGDWQPVIDELRELFDAAVESVAEENLPAEFRKADAS